MGYYVKVNNVILVDGLNPEGKRVILTNSMIHPRLIGDTFWGVFKDAAYSNEDTVLLA